MKSLSTLIIILIILTSNNLIAQDDFLFTKKFTRQLEKYDLEFYLPVERWLKTSPVTEDDYMTYDLVLHSPPNVEVRIDIDRDHTRYFPNVEIGRIMAHISTNNDDAVIEITQYPGSYAREHYGADLALYADFIPKVSYSTMPHGRLLCLYKEGRALIKYVILYEGALDTYFKMPLRFREEGVE